MDMKTDPRAGRSHFVERANLGMSEFVALAAFLTAAAAMSVDIFLPALPAIGDHFGIADDNRRQLVVVVFVLGFGSGQLLFGPLSDYYGRKPMLLAGLSMMVVSVALGPLSPDFSLLLVARLFQGFGASAVRSVVVATVRDCFRGEEMGRIMSMVFSAFMIVPVAAPLAGQGLLHLSGWTSIFYGTALLFAGLFLWTALRLQETLDDKNRRKLTPANILMALREIVTNRTAAGYTVAATLTFSGLFSYITLVQQIYGELYGLGDWFPVAFALSSVGMAIGSIVNTRLVPRLGLRKMTHSAFFIYALSGVVLALWNLVAQPPFEVAFALITIAMVGFTITQSTIGALAMEPLGHMAGIASSIFGVVTTSCGVVIGGLVGQAYNGTLYPISIGLAVSGILAIAVTLWTERGKLFG